MTLVDVVSAVHARAPGKINVFLAVGAKMADGFHDVATAYQAVSLFEDVYAYPADTFSVSFRGSIDTSGLVTDESNLAIRAARAMARAREYSGGVRLVIDKNVPVAGGMGGGSADAAATLVACDALWGLDVPKDEMLELARSLGADVPFALAGGTAIGTGRGDSLSPALAKGTFNWVLAFADFGLSSPAVYNELDAHLARNADNMVPAPDRPTVDADVLQALRAGDAHLLAESIHNDLQAPALHLAPELARVLEIGDANGALAGVISGSGPTVAFLTADVDSALELQIALSASRLTAVRACGPVHGARIVGD